MFNTFIVSRLSIFLNLISYTEFRRKQRENQMTTIRQFYHVMEGIGGQVGEK